MITAQSIVDYAAQHNLKIRRWGSSEGIKGTKSYCALGIAALMGEVIYPRFGIESLGMSEKDVDSLENGFENWEEFQNDIEDPYYKIGQEVYNMIR